MKPYGLPVFAGVFFLPFDAVDAIIIPPTDLPFFYICKMDF